jgi:cytochrome c peroxidase
MPPASSGQVGLPVAATLAVVPSDNPQTPDKVALGKRLFFERRLSADGTVACSSCHDPARAFTDGRPASVGIMGRLGERNGPTVLNALYSRTMFWDGRAVSLEDQAVLPILNPSEMGQPDLDTAVAAIAGDRNYWNAFERVFGRPPNGVDLTRALASWERTQVSFGSPFDSFIAGDMGAISEPARRGWNLFTGKARCNSCHALSASRPDQTFFTDHSFHNIGIGIERHNVVALACRAQAELNSGNRLAVDRAAIQSELSALGSFLVTKQPADIASFKTPGLRNVLVTAPYFHDGSARTLWDVVDHYNKGGMNNPWLDPSIRPLALSERDIDDIVAFLASLTGAQYRGLGVQEFARQREIARTSRPERDPARAFGPKPALPDAVMACTPTR